jgi:hypothetical protein
MGLIRRIKKTFLLVDVSVNTMFQYLLHIITYSIAFFLISRYNQRRLLLVDVRCEGLYVR